MATNKNNPQSGSKGSMESNPDREFESQGKNKDFGKGEFGQEAGGSRKGTSSPGNMEDDDLNTAGGRKGQFSDSDRGSQGQWSPGADKSSDQ